MYSASTRFNNIFFFTSVVLGVASFLNFTSSYFYFQGIPKGDISVTSFEKFYPVTTKHHYGGNQDWEQATFKFNLTTDLNPLFTWNLKQIFLYINVQFTNPQNGFVSNNIIYDRIVQIHDNPIQRMKDFNITLSNLRMEYPIRDIYKQLRGQVIKLQIWTEIMPHVGIIYNKMIHEEPYKMPTNYIK